MAVTAGVTNCSRPMCTVWMCQWHPTVGTQHRQGHDRKAWLGTAGVGGRTSRVWAEQSLLWGAPTPGTHSLPAPQRCSHPSSCTVDTPGPEILVLQRWAASGLDNPPHVSPCLLLVLR